MKQHVTPKGLQIIAVVTMLGVAAVLLIQRFGPYPRQMANMAAAKEHIEILRPMIHQDARFTNIKLYPFTGRGGSLSVSGELLSDRDLADLKEIVERSKPPVQIAYHVGVIPPGLLDELSRTNK
jgi:hypothetical protein